MEIRIINDEQYAWQHVQNNGVYIFFKGGFWKENTYFEGLSACEQLSLLITNATFSVVEIKKIIAGVKGHCAYIIDTPAITLAVTDKIRTIPIFYAMDDTHLYISNSAKKVRQANKQSTPYSDGHLELLMAGYVTGKNTLFNGIYQLQAGELLLHNKEKNNIETHRYYMANTVELTDKPEDELMEELHQVILTTFSSLVKTLDGRPVWIPLSGGLDSRLVLAMLLQFGYKNIETFTYGAPGLWEVHSARKIAEYLKVSWRYIPYYPKKIKKLFHSQDRRDFFQYACADHTVPIVNDYYAILELLNRGTISGQAIFVNGQAGDFITGGHIPKMPSQEKLKVDLLLYEIVSKHFSLWEDQKTLENLAVIHRRILENTGLKPDQLLSKQEFAAAWETYEWQERQSKFVANGQRVYEWLGFDWRLPLWSEEMIKYWDKIRWQDKFGQGLFKKYLSKVDPGKAFNIEFINKKKRKPRASIPISIVNKIFYEFDRISGKQYAPLLYKKYTAYFTTHASLYPHLSYLEYLKDNSAYHRTPISYYAKGLANNSESY